MKLLAIQLLNFLLLLQIFGKPLSEEENNLVIDLNVGSEQQDNSYFGAAIGEITQEMKEQMAAEEDFTVDLWSLRDGSGAIPIG